MKTAISKTLAIQHLLGYCVANTGGTIIATAPLEQCPIVRVKFASRNEFRLEPMSISVDDTRLPSMSDIALIVTKPSAKWLDDKSWADYDF